ncbi:MAG: ATP-binding cassette domain-containing protein, partial [Candidatus Omnitrophica bacterium]|nr:ATP-binding cassette domain-containing protein [Candidatus Omnitrophota bacterium]
MIFPYCQHRHSSPDRQAPALKIRSLRVSYSSEDKFALKDFDISIPAGSATALVGPNGAGKSTLFKAVCGLLPVRNGSIEVFGRALGACHHRVVYLPQRSAIDWFFPISVLELVLMGRYVYLGWFKRPVKADVDLARQSLKEMNALDLAGRQISKLSGGQQQRVLIARALAQDADLLLLDEPLNAVDASTRETVANVLHKVKSQGKTVIVATHYYDQEEGRYDQAVYLKDGKKVDPE